MIDQLSSAVVSDCDFIFLMGGIGDFIFLMGEKEGKILITYLRIRKS